MEFKEVLFVYLGTSIPRYVHSSLELAVRHSGMNVVIILNESLKKNISNPAVELVSIEDFYDPTLFNLASRRVVFEHNFRNGFWLKSMERIFVLEQYMRETNRTSILHAELDQCLFRLDDLVERLEKSGKKGFFVPFHSPNAAVASVIFCNKIEAIQSIINFALQDNFFLNEMTLIANAAAKPNSEIIAMPTYATEIINRDYIEPMQIQKVESSDIGGFLDAAQLGQWVGGIDPRNISIRNIPTTKFVDIEQNGLLKRSDLQKLHFTFDSTDSNLFLKDESNQLKRLYNLHLHSKSHSWIEKSADNMGLLFKMANFDAEARIPGMRLNQIFNVTKDWHHLIKKNYKLVFRKIWKETAYRVGIKPIAYSFVSEHSFKKVCDLNIEDYLEDFDSLEHKTLSYVFCESKQIELLCQLLSEEKRVKACFIVGSSRESLNLDTITRLSGLAEKTNGVFVFDFLKEVGTLKTLPLGIDVLSQGYFRLRKLQSGVTKHDRKRIYRFLWNLTVDDFVEGRSESLAPLIDFDLAIRIDSTDKVTLEDYLLRYAFFALEVASNKDVNLMWLSIYSGCCPVVLRNSYVERMVAMGLPIWVVDNFSELTTLDLETLVERFERFRNLLLQENIWIDYWVDNFILERNG